MTNSIGEGDWVLICETGEKGQVEMSDFGERFLVRVEASKDWPYAKRVHVMVEKVKKIRPPVIRKEEIFWEQRGLFDENSFN